MRTFLIKFIAEKEVPLPDHCSSPGRRSKCGEDEFKNTMHDSRTNSLRM
jgi:hypothetical protein